MDQLLILASGLPGGLKICAGVQSMKISPLLLLPGVAAPHSAIKYLGAFISRSAGAALLHS
jgi:hypothetical protein